MGKSFLKKFIVFRVLENAQEKQKIKSRHFYSCLLGRTVPKIFIIFLQEMGNYSSAQAAFFENILRGV